MKYFISCLYLKLLLIGICFLPVPVQSCSRSPSPHGISHVLPPRDPSCRPLSSPPHSPPSIASSFCPRKHLKSLSHGTIQKTRGGAAQPTDPTRAFWSSSSSPPSSFYNSSQSRAQTQPYRQVTVTDVTNDIKDQEREKTKEAINAFLTRESRNSFIVKVYTILTGQLLMVALSALLFGRYPSLGRWMMTRGKFVPMASLLLSTITVLLMTISERARQVAPLKWQLLGLFSISEAIVVGLISSFYKSKTVMSAALSTAVATMSVTMYTFLNKDSKRDLSQWGAGLSSMGMIFVFYGIIHLLSMSGILPPEFLPYNETIYCFLGASLFTLYLAYHTRLVVSGKHSKYQLNEKDYVFGAVLLYNDIINMFLYMLRLMAADDRE